MVSINPPSELRRIRGAKVQALLPSSYTLSSYPDCFGHPAGFSRFWALMPEFEKI
jgi:hypothetical protein